jgi:hypothetical protein
MQQANMRAVFCKPRTLLGLMVWTLSATNVTTVDRTKLPPDLLGFNGCREANLMGTPEDTEVMLCQDLF